jgi:cellulose synthase/poly-beta-1,6-N-acetylglucosamine synthase-like glycosyltransferase
VVVDDGSKDGTALALPPDPRVLCLRQPNCGKSAALNRALEHAGEAGEDEIVVCLDADTQIDSAAIGHLVSHFADPQVAAVAGNIKVGNRNNLLTFWQSIEYITCQNLDRRAYARLNAIPVVPGALGAWRRAALSAVGNFQRDTLAEDMDLTLRLLRAGYRVANEPRARAYTEAPQTVMSFFRQRLRWTYGTLQCLWKHRGAVGRRGWLGCLVLPSLWFYHILLQLLCPLADAHLLWGACHGWGSSASLALGFILLETWVAWGAFRRDGESTTPLILLLTQRLVYRQILYWVVLHSLGRAALGLSPGWGKLDRNGTVK